MPKFAIAYMHLQESELNMEVQEGKTAHEAISKVVALKPYLDFMDSRDDSESMEEVDLKSICYDGEMFVNWIEV